MANNDALWFEMGVRDEVTRKIQAMIAVANQLGMALDEATMMKRGISNAENLERAYDKIAIAIGRINEARAKTSDKGELQRLKDMEREVNKMYNAFKKLQNSGDLISKDGATAFEKLSQGLALAVSQVARYTNEIDNEAKIDERNKAAEGKRIDTLKEKYYELYRTKRELQDAVMNSSPTADTTEAMNLLQILTSKRGLVSRAMKNGYGVPQGLQGADYEELLKRVKDAVRQLSGATDEYNHRLRDNETIQNNLHRLGSDTESQKKIAAIRKQTIEYTALQQKLLEIRALEREVNQENADLASGKITTPKLTRDVVNQRLDDIQNRYNETLARGKQREKEMADAKNQQAASSKRAAEAIQMLSHVNQGLVSSYNRIAEAGNRANRVTIQFQNQLANYTSLYAFERILKSVITIGGQFEYQHMALQNIIGDVQEANVLFGQLQELAIESPKTFMELTSYVKQLAAYQIPVNELFDTTKRLADMSSGLGVDMSRLILAYGQVRSAAVLRGQELRQFTEAGIPLVQKLAEKFTELNGKLTTTADVFKLISARKVPFEMVKEIMWDMTSQGGQFYNMQAELADTLYGKWQKLQDQWQITLGHIADGTSMTGKLLKWLLEGTVQLASVVDTLTPAIGMFGLTMLGKQGVRGVANIMESRNGNAAIKRMELAMQENITRLERERVIYGRQLNAEEQALVNSGGQLRSQEYYILGIEKQISAQKAYQLMLDGKMEKSHFYKMLQMQGYTREQRKQIANGEIQVLQQEKGMLSKFRNVWNFMGGWWGAGLMAVGGILSALSYIDQKNEELSQKGESMMSHAQQTSNDLKKTLLDVEASSDSASKKVEVLEETLANMGEEGRRIVSEGRNIADLQQRFESLNEKATAYQETLERIGNTEGKALHEQALEDSDIEEYIRKYEKFRAAEAKETANLNRFSTSYKQMVEAMKADHEELRNLLTSTNVYENMRNLYMAGYKNDALGYFASGAERASLRQYFNAIEQTERAFKKMESESIPRAMNALRAEAEKAGVDLLKPFDKLNDTEKEALRTVATNFANSLTTAEQDTRNSIANWVAQGFYAQLYLIPSVKGTILHGYSQQLDDFQNTFLNGRKIWNEQELKDANNDPLGFDQKNSKRWEELTKNITKYTAALDKATGARKEALQARLDADTQEKADLDLAKANNQWTYIPTKKTGAGGSKKDTELEYWKNRVSLLEKYRKELEELENLMTRSAAESKLREDKNFESLWNYFSNPNDYKGSLDEVLDALGKDLKGERQKFADDLGAKKQAENMREYKDSVKDAVSELSRMLSVMSENYQTYKKWMDLTGDAELAARIAGVAQNTTYADYLKERMSEELKKANVELSAEEVFGYKEGAAKELGKDNTIFKLWEEWQNNNKKLRKEQLDMYEDAIKNSKTYADKIDDVNRKLKEQIAAVEAFASDDQKGKLTEGLTKNAEKEISKIKWEQFKDENGFGDIFGDLGNVPLKKLKKLIKSMKELSTSTHLEVVEAKALNEAMSKVVTQVAEKDSISAISTAYKNYKTAKDNIAELEGMRELVKNGGYDKYKNEDDLDKAIEKERAAMQSAYNDLKKAVKAFSGQINELGNSFKKIGNTLGGTVGNVIGGIGSIFNSIGTSLGAISNLNLDAGGLEGIVSNVSAIVTVISAMVDMNIELSKILPDSYSMYEKYAEKAREVNKLREAMDDYRISVAEARAEESEWFAGNDLSKLRAKGDKAKETLSAYFKELYEGQEPYQEKGSGLAKWGVPIAAGIAALAVGILTAGAGAGASFAILGSAVTAGLATGTLATVVGAAVVAGVGTAVGQIAQSAVESISYKDGEIAAINNMKIQTQHSSFWRGEKVQDLQEWTRENLNAELFDEEGLVNLEAAQEILDKYGNKLVGDTKETLEKLVELRKEYDEFIKQIEDYVGEIGNSLADGMTNAIWDWLSNGEDALDKFYEYASDIWKKISQDIVKTFLKVAVLDKYSEIFKNLFKDWSLGYKTNDQLAYDVAFQAGLLAKDFEVALPMAEQLANILDQAFGAQGYDIKNNEGSSSSSSSATIKSVTENTADIIASYINAIRADVSVNRATLMQILMVVQTQTEMPVIARAQLTQLQLIARNTGNNVEIVGQIYDLLHKVENGAASLKVK